MNEPGGRWVRFRGPPGHPTMRRWFGGNSTGGSLVAPKPLDCRDQHRPTHDKEKASEAESEEEVIPEVADWVVLRGEDANDNDEQPDDEDHRGNDRAELSLCPPTDSSAVCVPVGLRRFAIIVHKAEPRMNLVVPRGKVRG